MKNQSCQKEFFKYCFLSILGMLGVSCYILADTFFVSKGLKTKGLAALNLAIPIYNFIHGSGLMLGMGGATKFSIAKSRNEKENMNKIFTNTIYLSVIFAIVFVLCGVYGSKFLAACLGADAAVFEMTDTYLKWLLIFAPAFIINDVLLCFVRNDGNPKLSMIAMFIGSMANIALDYIFIFPMQMGIFGAVLATGLSPIISVVVMSPHWLKKKNEFHFVKSKLYAKIAKSELAIGFPSLIAQLSSGIVMIIFNVLILKLQGNTGVAAYGVIANISLVIVAVYTGIAQGIQPLISKFYGVNDADSMNQVLRYAMITMLAISCGLYAVIFFFAGPIAGIFNSENNIELQQSAVTGLKLYFTSVAFTGYNIIISQFFASVEKTAPAHILSLLRGFIIMVPMAFFMSAVWKITGIWLTYPVTELLVMAVGVEMHGRYRKREKEGMGKII